MNTEQYKVRVGLPHEFTKIAAQNKNNPVQDKVLH